MFMKTLVRYFDGSVDVAIVLAVIGSRLRLALPGREDVTEFQWANGQYVNETGEFVSVDLGHKEAVGWNPFERGRSAAPEQSLAYLARAEWQFAISSQAPRPSAARDESGSFTQPDRRPVRPSHQRR